jgi:hypothetical protein
MSIKAKSIIRVAILLCFVVISFMAYSQQRFRAGVILGLNASQVNGDDIGGYNKLGLHGGLKGIAKLDERKEFSLELLYAQRGSYQKDSPFGGPLKINLQYVEVPFVFTYKDWLDEEEEYYRIQANAGFSFGRLLKADAEGSKFDDITSDFNATDIGVTVGIDYFTRKNFGFGLRWTRSINKLYNNKKDPGRNSLVGYFLSFRGQYYF